MSKVYFATKDDLNTEINNINTSLGVVQTDLDKCNNTAVKRKCFTRTYNERQNQRRDIVCLLRRIA